MLKLLKYEFRKTILTKLILLGLTAVLEVLYLVGILRHNESLCALGASLLAFTAIAALILIGVQSVLTLSRDMNTKQSYMLFMTPRTCYEILGAKVIEFVLSILLTGAFFFALGALDVTLLFQTFGSLKEMMETLRYMLEMFQREIAELNLYSVMAIMFDVACTWISTISIAYLAVIISSALLRGKRWNILISFVLFVALGLLTSWLIRLIPDSIEMVLRMVLRSAAALVLAVVMYLTGAAVMEKYLSV